MEYKRYNRPKVVYFELEPNPPKIKITILGDNYPLNDTQGPYRL